MSDVFDGMRTKIRRHITTDVTKVVLNNKNAEFIAQGERIADDIIKDPKFEAMIRQEMEDMITGEAAIAIQRYFKSQDFKDRCKIMAKGMLK